MPGQAIFSNISSVIYSKAGQTYNSRVKRFRAELKRQKIVPTIRTGYLKSFFESEIITEEEFKKIFRYSYDVSSYIYAEITIFTWE